MGLTRANGLMDHATIFYGELREHVDRWTGEY